MLIIMLKILNNENNFTNGLHIKVQNVATFNNNKNYNNRKQNISN